MPVYKDEKQGTYYASFYFTDYTGKRKKKMKRGFARKREAQEWERQFLMQESGDLEMTFGEFVEIYYRDIEDRIRATTWMSKKNIIDTKILPYFKDRVISEIEPKDIIAWQNEMMHQCKSDDKAYAPTYLKTIQSQLSAIFNYAVRYYKLRQNPAAVAGGMGKAKHKEMLFWTQEEYSRFAEAMMDKPMSYYAFEILYWCGLRVGEMLALTASDFDFSKNTLRISKSYQRIHGKDILTDPKTVKGIRTIQIPQFLADEMQDYIKSLYGLEPDDRLFQVTRHYLTHEMIRGAKEAGVKKIRIHDLRHSHVSLLISMGYSAVEIGERVGHESIDITYRYAHMFPSRQADMANKLNERRMKEDSAHVAEGL